MHVLSNVYACMHAKWSFRKTNTSTYHMFSADVKLQPLALSSIEAN
jgi:hypothetical protein